MSKQTKISECKAKIKFCFGIVLKFKINNTEILHRKSEKAAYNIYHMFPLNSFLVRHKKQVFIDLIEKYFTEKEVQDFKDGSINFPYIIVEKEQHEVIEVSEILMLGAML